MVQPAPRISSAPEPNRHNVYRLGNWPTGVANMIPHEHGQNKSHEPNNIFNYNLVQNFFRPSYSNFNK